MAEPESFDDRLEAEIAATPDERGPYAVYADWLQQQGNPRGELAMVQLTREIADTGALEQREAALLAQHASMIRGSYPQRHTQWLDDFCEIEYRGGFWRTVRFHGPIEVLHALLAHPSARVLHTLQVSGLDRNDDAYDTAVDAIVTSPRRHETLRVLVLGDAPEGQSALAGFGDRTVGDLSRLATSCPRLATLRLLCPSFAIGDQPMLRVLDARLGATPASIAALAMARLPALEVLELGYQCAEDEPMYPSILWSDDTLDALAAGHACPALRSIRLWCMSPEEDATMLARLRASPLGRRLDRVELGDWAELENDGDSDGVYVV